MDPKSNLSLGGLGQNKLMAPESFKLSSWDPAVFASDILATQAGPRNFEQTAKVMSATYGKIMMRLVSLHAGIDLHPNKSHQYPILL
jgi:hypothetical protein